MDTKTLDTYFAALISGDLDRCTDIVQAWLNRRHQDTKPVPIRHGQRDDLAEVFHLYQQLLQPALYRVGEWWAQNRLSVATEHIATAITESLLNQFYPQIISSVRVGHKVVLSPIQGELHQVGVKMVADVFESYGWDSVILGAGTTIEELLQTVATERPALVGLSFSVGFHTNMLLTTITRLAGTYPQLPVWVGGQGLASCPVDLAQTAHTVRPVRSLNEVAGLLRAFDRGGHVNSAIPATNTTAN